MKIRGIDPGPEWLAWCDIDISSGRPTFVAMGETPAAEAVTLVIGAQMIAIEIAVALLIGSMASIQEAKSKTEKMLLTNRVADRIVHAAGVAGVRLVEIDQDRARRGLGVMPHMSGVGPGKMKADKQVEVIVREMIVGFPAKKRDSNPDKRDAGLYALHGWQRLSTERATTEEA